MNSETNSSNDASHSADENSPSGFDFADPNSPLARIYLTPWGVIATGIICFLFYMGCNTRLIHSDIWGHLKFGQWIVTHQQLPQHEPFSPFSDKEAIYVNFQWITQVIYYAVYQAGAVLSGDSLQKTAGGVEALRIFHGLLIALRFSLLLLAFRRISGSLPLSCFGLLLVLLTVSPFIQRPEAVGTFFFALTIYFLSPLKLGRWSLLKFPFLFVLWANSHGSFSVGLFLLAVCFLGRVIAICIEKKSILPAIGDLQVRRLFAIGLLSAAAISLLNPHGPFLFLHVLRLSQNPNIATLDEWQPVTLTAWPFYPVLLGIVIVSLGLSWRKISPTSVLLVLTFGLFPLLQVRMIQWWAMVGPWVVLPHLASLAENRRGLAWLKGYAPKDLKKTLLAGALIFLTLCWNPITLWILNRHPTPLNLSLWPGTPWKLAKEINDPDSVNELKPLAEVIAEKYPNKEFEGVIYASDLLGEYLLWELPEKFPVFAYTHAHLFPEEHWNKYLRVSHGKKGWQKILDRHAVNLIVVEPSVRKNLVRQVRSNPNWKVVLDEGANKSFKKIPTDQFIAIRLQPKRKNN